MLNKILEEFEKSNHTIQLRELAKKMEIDPSALEGMLEHWVRKGRLEAHDHPDDENCSSCAVSSGCSSCGIGMNYPKSYSLVTKQD